MENLNMEKTFEKQSVKHPRLIMLLNCWGGMCLNAIIQTSGLFDKILGFASNFDPALLGLLSAFLQ